MSKTPETDAQETFGASIGADTVVPSDFARKLERERNLLREEMERLKGHAKRYRMRAGELERERDEARKHVRELVETWDCFYIQLGDGTTKTFSEALKSAKHYLQSVTS